MEGLNNLSNILTIIGWLVGALGTIIGWIGVRLHKQLDKISETLEKIHSDNADARERITTLEVKFDDHLNNHFIIDRRKNHKLRADIDAGG